MATKNLLLANGELLTRKIELPRGGGEKSHPYSYQTARQRLIPKIKKLVESIHDTPIAARPKATSVVKITLHPAYLAKSYFPVKFLRYCGLRSIGSKEVFIKPHYSTKVSSREKESTACLYVSGTERDFESLYTNLSENNYLTPVQDDIRKIEDIAIFDTEEKIKSIDPESKWLDVALHATGDDEDIITAFSKYVKGLDGLADTKRKIIVGGLTFLPVKISPKQVQSLAQFSLLRVVRSMPKLSIEKPTALRQLITSGRLEIEESTPLDEDLRVAIFDGGIGISDLDPWVTEHIKTSGNRSTAPYIKHGNDVTSAFLFGRISAGQSSLPQPLAYVDHYRVIDSSSGGDPDLYDVLIRIKGVLEERKHRYINLSLGPQYPIEDDDVHVWTSTLEQFLSDGNVLAFVAVGNDGKHYGPMGRIQPPSDMVNSMAIGAADSCDSSWKRAEYSCKGPGRSPGKIKPDGMGFGGTEANPVTLYSALDQGIVGVFGTSFASPLTLRTAVGVASTLDHPLTAIAIKALLIHHAENNSESRFDVGWGKFPENIDDIITCLDNEATLLYQGALTASQWLKAPIPFPNTKLGGNVTLKATFCYASDFDPEHPVNYTRSGLEVRFRKNESGDTAPFFSGKNLYPTEQHARRDAHKWETSLHHEQTFRRSTLDHPSFDVVYRAREGGQSISPSLLRPLPYALVVTIRARNTPNLYNNIVQRYKVLQPVRLKTQVTVRTRGG